MTSGTISPLSDIVGWKTGRWKYHLRRSGVFKLPVSQKQSHNLSGQVIIFHQSRFSRKKAVFLPKRYHPWGKKRSVVEIGRGSDRLTRTYMKKPRSSNLKQQSDPNFDPSKGWSSPFFQPFQVPSGREFNEFASEFVGKFGWLSPPTQLVKNSSSSSWIRNFPQDFFGGENSKHVFELPPPRTHHFPPKKGHLLCRFCQL